MSWRRQQYACTNSHESESARSTRFVVLHHDTVDDFAIAAEITLQAVLSCLPAETAHEKFPRKRQTTNISIKIPFLSREKNCHIIKKMSLRGSIFENKSKFFFFFPVCRRFVSHFSRLASTFLKLAAEVRMQVTYPFSSSSTSTPGFIRIFPLCDWIFDDFLELNVQRKMCFTTNLSLFSLLIFFSYLQSVVFFVRF